MSALHTAWTPGGHVTHVVIDGQAVLMNTRTERYFGLDEIGTLIWERLSRSASGIAIAEDLACRYDVGADVVRADVERFLAELLARGLVVPAVASRSRLEGCAAGERRHEL